MKIIKLTESFTELDKLRFSAPRTVRKESDVLESLAKQIEDATENKEIVAIQYVEDKKTTGYIEYNNRDLNIRHEVWSITAYITVK